MTTSPKPWSTSPVDPNQVIDANGDCVGYFDDHVDADAVVAWSKGEDKVDLKAKLREINTAIDTLRDRVDELETDEDE